MTDEFRNRHAALGAIAERHPGLKKPTLKRYGWSRLHADLLDDARWCLVAQRAQAPLPFVEALLVRLEAHANKSDPRGYVGDFNAAAMAARWGVDAAIVLRIFAELERPEVGWIDQDQIVTFWLRNPDSDVDTTATERQRRKRDRDRAMKQAIMAGAALITSLASKKPLTAAERKRRQRRRHAAHGDVTNVTKGVTDQAVDFAQGVTKNVTSRVTSSVTCHASVTEKTATAQALDLSRRDSVTSRPEQSRIQDRNVTSAVTALGANLTPIDPAVFVDQAKALQWLKGDGEALLMHRGGWLRSRACQAIERWTLALHDARALTEVIYGALATTARGEAFRKLVDNQVARRATEQTAPALPLPPVPVRRS